MISTVNLNSYRNSSISNNLIKLIRNKRTVKIKKLIRRRPKEIDFNKMGFSNKTIVINSTRRRILIRKSRPTTRKRLTITRKRKLIKSTSVLPTALTITTEKLNFQTITTTTTRQRTYTYIVTRVNGDEHLVMSSTTVREQIKPVTETLTSTQLLIFTIPVSEFTGSVTAPIETPVITKQSTLSSFN